jgi:hypothetical protein
MFDSTQPNCFIARLALITGLILGLNTVTATASTYDAVADFSAVNNSNGVWSYLDNGSILTNHNASGLPNWWNGQPIPNSVFIGQNTSGSTVNNATLQIPTGYLVIDPEAHTATVEFTAAVTGSYTISGQFIGADIFENAHSVSIFNNGTSLWSNTISSIGQADTFSITANILAGSTIDFKVLTGSSGCSYCNLSTGLQATIVAPAAVPVPSAIWLFGSAIVGYLGFNRRKTA